MTDPAAAGPPPPYLPASVPPAVPAPVTPGAAAPVPSPPPGPGVLAPFPVPPTEGRSARVWWGLGLGGLLALLCCGVGVTAVVGIALTTTEALNEQVDAVVGEYFDAVRDGNYRGAYTLLCDEAQRQETPEEFTRRVEGEQDITAYRIGDVAIDRFIVPVDVTYDTGGTDVLRVRLDQDSNTGEFEVCEVER